MFFASMLIEIRRYLKAVSPNDGLPLLSMYIFISEIKLISGSAVFWIMPLFSATTIKRIRSRSTAPPWAKGR